MRKRLSLGWICILVFLLALSVQTIVAAPLAQGARAVISSPSMNAVVRGKVLINGSATHPNFWKYEIHIAREPNSNQWNVIGVHEQQVIDGLLETWDTTTAPDGSYSVLLRVVDKTGNYQEYIVRQVSVGNAKPTDTPRPTNTRAATNTAVPKASPTVILIQPTTDLSPATPTPTLERPATRPSALAVPTIDTKGWKDAFLMGAGAAAAIFVLVGLIYLIRRIL
jgi:hypothetical protein